MTMEVIGMRRYIAAGLLTLCAAMGLASTASANPNPSGTGPPNQMCQSFSARPGHSASSPGSPFNEPGINSPSGGKGGTAYNNAGAPAQYDVACYQQASVH